MHANGHPSRDKRMYVKGQYSNHEHFHSLMVFTNLVRPGMTFVVDWALKSNIYVSLTSCVAGRVYDLVMNIYMQMAVVLVTRKYVGKVHILIIKI